MFVREIIDILDAEILTEGMCLEETVHSAFATDLISDLMAFVNDDVLLLTGLRNLQVIRAAEMMDLRIIVFVRGKRPDQTMLDMAKEKGICVLLTSLTMFVASGKLYEKGLRGRGADCWQT